MPVLFDRLGGFAALSKVVLAFYDHVLDDDMLAAYFADVDMRRLIDHQTKFMAYLMDGPASYSDDHLRLAHARLDIDATAFDRIVDVMRTTLEDFGMAERDIGTVVSKMRSKRDLIVTRVAA
jgi:hemoglobin